MGGREVSGQFVSDIAVLHVTHSTSGWRRSHCALC